MKTTTEFGPWTMNAAHECRLNSFWKQRFNALQRGSAKRASLRHGIGLLLLLMLMICMPSWRLGERTATAQERPITVSDPWQRSELEVPTPPTIFHEGAVRTDRSRTRPHEVESSQPGAIPKVTHPWQLVDSSQLPESNKITLIAGRHVNLDMPIGGAVSTTASKGVFSAKLDDTTGDIRIHGEKSGVGSLSFSQGDRKQVDFQVVVVTDPAPLKWKLEQAQLGHIKITPGVQSVILSGNVTTPEELKQCNALADDLYPHVVNNIRIRNQQQVMLHCRIFEFTTTEVGLTSALDQLFGGNDHKLHDKGIYSSLLDSKACDTRFDELKKMVDVNMLAEPTLATLSGRPATFNAGGEFPILVPQAAEFVAVEYKQFGTRVDLVPRVLDDGRIRLELRPQVTQLMGDKEHSVQVNGVTIPALRQRWVDVASEMNTDQTMVVALIHKNDKGETVGFVTMVRPSLISATEPSEIPTDAMSQPVQADAKPVYDRRLR